MNLGLEAGEQIRSTGTTGQQGPTGGTPCKLVGGQWAAGSDLRGRRRNKLDTAPRRSTRREQMPGQINDASQSAVYCPRQDRGPDVDSTGQVSRANLTLLPSCNHAPHDYRSP